MPRPRYHAAVSLTLAAVVVLRTRRWRDAIPILIAGVLVDLDHLVDLAVNRSVGEPRYMIMPLHAWEWVAALLLKQHRNLAGGLAAHLALDQHNRLIRHPLFYVISVRARYGFRAEAPLIEPADVKESAKWMFQSPRDWL